MTKQAEKQRRALRRFKVESRIRGAQWAATVRASTPERAIATAIAARYGRPYVGRA